MGEEKKSFSAFCIARKVAKEKAAAIAAAAGLNEDTPLTKQEFGKLFSKFGFTLSERLEQKSVPQKDWAAVAKKSGIELEAIVSGHDFGQIFGTWKKAQKKNDTPAPTSTETPARKILYTPAGCSLKYKKRWLLPGDKSDFADLSDEERSLLLDQGKIKKV